MSNKKAAISGGSLALRVVRNATLSVWERASGITATGFYSPTKGRYYK
jgi:hypothetical protein